MLKRLFGRREEPPAPPPSPQVDTVAQALDWAAGRPAAAAVIRIDSARNHYVQFASGNGSLTAEAVSNAYLKPEDALDPGQEGRLQELGYTLSGDGSGNWSTDFAGWPASRTQAELLLLQTMRDVFGYRDGSRLEIDLIE